MATGSWEGSAVWAAGSTKGWVDSKQINGSINISIRGFDVDMTPEAAKVLARQLSRLANDMIKRRVPT